MHAMYNICIKGNFEGFSIFTTTLSLCFAYMTNIHTIHYYLYIICRYMYNMYVCIHKRSHVCMCYVSVVCCRLRLKIATITFAALLFKMNAKFENSF